MKDLIQEGRDVQEKFKKNLHSNKSNSLNEGPIFQKIKDIASNIKNAITNMSTSIGGDGDENKFADVSSINNLISSLMKWADNTDKKYTILGEKSIQEYAKILQVGSNRSPLSGMEIVIKNKNYIVKSVDSVSLQINSDLFLLDGNISVDTDCKDVFISVTIQESDSGVQKRYKMNFEQFTELLDASGSV